MPTLKFKDIEKMNEEERKKIAKAGYFKTISEFSLKENLKKTFGDIFNLKCYKEDSRTKEF